MLKEINESLATLNENMDPYKLAYVSVDQLEEIDLNAHYMNFDKFNALVSNIQADGQLASVPLCQRMKNGKYEVLSGNHRLAAAKSAGIENILVLFIPEEIDTSRKRAIQVSHNYIVGEDDQQLLREIMEQIQAVEDRVYAGISDEELDRVTFVMPTEFPIEYFTYSLLFLPEQRDLIEKILDKIDSHLMKNDANFALRLKEHKEFMKTIKGVKKVFDIRSNSNAILKAIELAGKHVGALTENHEKGWVPLSEIFITYSIPEDLADMIRGVIEDLRKTGIIRQKNTFQVLEYAFAEFIAANGPEKIKQIIKEHEKREKAESVVTDAVTSG